MKSVPLSIVLLAFVVTGPLLRAAGRAEASKGPDASRVWAIEVASEKEARQVAEKSGAVFLGQVGSLEGFYKIGIRGREEKEAGRREPVADLVRTLEADARVDWAEEQVPRRRVPRQLLTDPRFEEQWHLRNRGQVRGKLHEDIEAVPVWLDGIEGEGVTIAVVDEGTDYHHPDLVDRVRFNRLLDLNEGDSDPSPSFFDEGHGTAVAGIALASRNRVGGAGVAPEARLAPVRLIAENNTDAEEAEAMMPGEWADDVAIFNNSWGPPNPDTGVSFSRPGRLMREALQQGVLDGRNGLGNLFIWSAGNGALEDGNANYDGYTASPWTIAVGAVGVDGRIADYSEPGANVLLSAPSRGNTGRGIGTTDVRGREGYTDDGWMADFSGTSAAAPIVSGVAALILDARPDLSWRDVKMILALSAEKIDLEDGDWRPNGVGLYFHHHYGFGRVNARNGVNLAQVWSPLPAYERETVSESPLEGVVDRGGVKEFSLPFPTGLTVEQVEVEVDFADVSLNDVEIDLISPSGSVSRLVEQHTNANSSVSTSFEWNFLSCVPLLEPAAGTWRLRVRHTASAAGFTPAFSLQSWSLTVHGFAAGSGIGVVQENLVRSLDSSSGADFPAAGLLPNQSAIGWDRPDKGDWASTATGYRYQMDPLLRGEDRVTRLVFEEEGILRKIHFRMENNRPLASVDHATVRAGTAILIPVLENDTTSGAPSVDLAGEARLGHTAVVGDEIRFTVRAGVRGRERLSYTVTDEAGTDRGYVEINIFGDEPVAFDFNGRDSSIELSSPSTLNLRDQFTIAASIRPSGWGEAATGFGRILDKGSITFFLNGEDHAFYPSRTLIIYLVLEDGSVTSAAAPADSITLGTWQNVAVTLTGPDRPRFDSISTGKSFPP